MYLLTHSLLSSWLYAMKSNAYDDITNEKDSLAEFVRTLKKEQATQTQAMVNGLVFEDLVTDIVNGDADTDHRWYRAAEKAAQMIKGGQLQYKAKKQLVVSGVPILLYGRLDVLKAGEIIDTKFSESYERGKYFHSTQHPTYFELIPEAYQFVYLISNGTEVWTETYRRDETPSIIPIIADFIDYLKANNLWDIYTSYWKAL